MADHESSNERWRNSEARDDQYFEKTRTRSHCAATITRDAAPDQCGTETTDRSTVTVPTARSSSLNRLTAMEALPQTNLSSSASFSSSSDAYSSEKLETVIHRKGEGGEGDDSSKVTMAEERQPEITAKSPSSTAGTVAEAAVDDPMIALGFLGLLGQPSKPSCANCENKEQSQPMYFCNTCCKWEKNLKKPQFHLLILNN